MIEWRKIEAALVRELRTNSLVYLQEDAKSGDKFGSFGHEGDCEINLTNLAKAIADDLNGA